ncbi:hypothetical protein B0T22DRAFT_192694 [Podospora appendiculata]|uniref:Zn(2)-C6 fungal-type domain-containing protein n=1 Tax=Podospora appendiculata TaxID=314037 RepID=A0AAE1CE42_9PEZI|nr:hypothetical protein B0T22DRAFT_192694 [Podospora appendiculata]
MSMSSTAAFEQICTIALQVQIPNMQSANNERSGKLLIACVRCQSRKARCDGKTPRCANCLTRHMDCQYPVARKSRGPGRKQVSRFLMHC